MNRKQGLIYIFLCVTLISIFITGIYFYDTDNKNEYYLLKEYDGKLAVFSENGTSLLEITDVDINIFPEDDKKSLQEGIKAYSEDELYRLIEDFSG
ncbi:MAG: BofC C-terminal domain-containing protein [Clostridia bacterium]|nr:BofC C-terminal domain-containing protein [Clostridia bacterium]